MEQLAPSDGPNSSHTIKKNAKAWISGSVVHPTPQQVRASPRRELHLASPICRRVVHTSYDSGRSTPVTIPDRRRALASERPWPQQLVSLPNVFTAYRSSLGCGLCIAVHANGPTRSTATEGPPSDHMCELKLEWHPPGIAFCSQFNASYIACICMVLKAFHLVLPSCRRPAP